MVGLCIQLCWFMSVEKQKEKKKSFKNHSQYTRFWFKLGKQLAYKLNVYEGQVTRLKCGGFTLGFALELVKKAKNEANEEYVHSVADLMATKERSCYPRLGSSIVSDLTKAGIIDVNFGWGKALYIWIEKGGFGAMPEVSFYNPYTNSKGEQGRVVLICLPEYAMERLEKELDIMHTHVINVQYLKDGNN